MSSTVTVNPARSPGEPDSPDASDGRRDPQGSLGDLRIADKVVEKVVSQVIREVPRAQGVARRVLGRPLGSVEPDESARVDADVDGGLVTLAASISVQYPQPIREVTAQVRRRVVDRVQEMLALEVVRFDIDVPHLYSPDQLGPVPGGVR